MYHIYLILILNLGNYLILYPLISKKIFFMDKLQIAPLNFGSVWISYPKISEFEFYPLIFRVFGFYTLTFQNLDFII